MGETTQPGLPRAPRVGTVAQVSAVLRMRGAALRGTARRRVLLGLALIPLLGIAAVVAGTAAPAAVRPDVVMVLPTVWLGFALTAALATATSGPRALLPAGQSAAFPVTAAAEHLGTLVLAPLNVAWLAQALGVTALTSWAVGPRPGLIAAEVVTAAWLIAATVAAQAIGWLVELTRTARGGPWVLRGAVVAGLIATAVLTASDRLVLLLDHAPTRPLVTAALDGAEGAFVPWAIALAGLAVGTAATYAAGAWLAVRVQRRPVRSQEQIETRRYPTRTEPSGALVAALRIDRAGVWRSAPLRRGLAALGTVPALAAAAAQLEWRLVVFLPCLVTAGVALLFGVNAFSLDGSGAVWRDSLPGSPRVLLGAHLIVVAELCLLASTAAVAVAAVRAPAAPTLAEAVAVVCAVVATSAQVVGRCATWSVERPYAAALRDARDQPAPPAAMAAYSARLALGTAATGIVLSTLADLGFVTATVAIGVAVTCLGARRAVAALRRWEDPAVRARVIATVSRG